MSDTDKYTLVADFDDVCDIHHCDKHSTGLWHGVSVEGDAVYQYTATYCKRHEMDHADPNDRLSKVGLIERQETDERGR